MQAGDLSALCGHVEALRGGAQAVVLLTTPSACATSMLFGPVDWAFLMPSLDTQLAPCALL